MNILILGAGVMQIPAIKKAKEMGLFVICADGNSEAEGKELCDLFYAVDLKDKNGLLELAEKFHNKHTLHGVFTAGTDFSSSVSWITEKLGLPGIPYQVALNATDKYRMRCCFKESNVPSPGFIEFSEGMDIEEKISDLSFPLVVKPVDSMGSRGVQKVSSLEELKDCVFTSIKHSRTSRAIIEEFIDGEEFSLDALVIDGNVKVYGFADREIQFPPFFVEMGHTIPSSISKENMESVIDVFTQGVKALGINYGCAKGDMKLTKKGPVIGEIAARLSGGFMSGWTYPYSSEIDLTKGGIELSLGQPVTIDKKPAELFCAERALISIPGIIKDIKIPYTLPKGIKNRFISSKVGDKVVFPKNNVEKCGNIISLAPSREKAIKLAEKDAGDILVRLEPSVWETEEFLFGDKIVYKAFDIDDNLYSHLDDDIETDGTTIFVSKIDKILKSRKKDWQKRTINQVLKQLKQYYVVEFVDDNECGLDFYKALINGSLQGVLYYLDTLEI